MCEELVELNLCNFKGSVTVLCWAILEPEGKKKISNIDPDFVEGLMFCSSWILFALTLIIKNIALNIMYLNNWDFWYSLKLCAQGALRLHLSLSSDTDSI